MPLILLLTLAGALAVSPLSAQSLPDADHDGVPDAEDCAALDARLATPHTYYWDRDGDQSGNTNDPLTICSVTPFPGSVAWGGDPADADNMRTALRAPKGDRTLGLEFSQTAEDGVWPVNAARELGAEATSAQLHWSLLEPGADGFVGPQAALLRVINDAYAPEGFGLSLTVSPISGRTLTMPSDLASGIYSGTRRFSDAAVIQRFTRLLDFIKAGLPDTRVVSLQIGHEVDLFYRVAPSPQFWADYGTFVNAVRAHARSLWGPSLRVGVTSTYAGLVNGPEAALMSQLNAAVDAVSVTYAPRGATFSAADPRQIRSDVEQLVARYWPKPLLFQQVAFASAPLVGSSTTRQSQSIRAFFEAWDAYAPAIPFASFSRLHDTTPAAALAEGRQAGDVPADQAARAQAFFSTLGLRTRAGAGDSKAAYDTLRTETLNRGWWRARALSARPYYVGFTPAPYDHDPGAPLKDDVLAYTGRTIGEHGDLIAYHFDNGVPWVEALNDPLTGEEPPYSAAVRDTWSKFRAIRPAGARVAVAINPLGVPRQRLAPYWGVGEGFYHDAAFNLVGTGVVQDYTERLLPSPWDTYRLNSAPVKQAFLNYARRTIQYFRPQYLITAIEANLALADGPARFAEFLELQQYLYTELRRDPRYDDVKLLVSFTAEHLMTDEYGVPLLVDGIQQPDLRSQHLAALTQLMPYVDEVGLSVYPIKTRLGSYTIPAGSLERLLASIRALTTKPIAITEMGFPASSFHVKNLWFPSTPEQQHRYLRYALTELAEAGNVEFVTHFSVRDSTPYLDKLRARSLETPPFVGPSLVEFYKYFEFIGLFGADGASRPAAALAAESASLPIDNARERVPTLTLSGSAGHLSSSVGVDAAGHLTYEVRRDGQLTIEPSPLGLTVDGVDLGTKIVNLEIESVRDIDETYPTRGAHRQARNRARETVLVARRGDTAAPILRIVWRAYDEGIAFRYVVPGSGVRTIAGEATGWTLPEGSVVWHQLSTSNYEGLYLHFPIGAFNTDVGGPVTAELPGGGYVSLTEGALRDYSGMTFDADLGSRVLKAQFLDDSAWQVPAGSMTPWRLAVVSATLDGLVNSDLVTHVNAPPDPTLFPQGAATGWIKPGRAVWSWWSDRNSGFSFDVQKQFVDYATRLRAEYAVVDAWWDVGFPRDGKDAFQRLRELVDYGHTSEKFVGIWVWRSWFDLLDATARRDFFRRVHDAGAVGVKIDNVFAAGSESMDGVRLLEAILRDAAQFKLMLNLHGFQKPTGLERTYPNLVAQESVAGMEYTALQWEEGITVPAEHNAAVPFVRYVAGSADFTPVTFDPRKLGETTVSHQLASAGVFHSPILHFAEHPEILLGQPLVQDVLRTLPTTWDETRVLPQSAIGRLVLMARRYDDRWYLFGMNGDAGHPVSLTSVPLAFLGDGTWNASLITDATRTSFARNELGALTRDSSVNLSMLPGGGLVMMFRQAPVMSRRVLQGFSSIPPSITNDGWGRGYAMLRDHADMVSHSFQEGIPWPEALQSSDPRTYSQWVQAHWALNRSADDAVIPTNPRYLMINPIETVSYARLAPYLGERDYMPLPAPWDQYAFNHPSVKAAYLNYLIAAIEYFHPTYLATSVEANILLAKAPEKWAQFLELHQFIYVELKKRYPALTVFTTIHYEHMLGLAEESRALALQMRDIYPDVLESEAKSLLRYSDLVAISTYPYMMENNRYMRADGRLDFDYFDRAYAIARELGKPLAIEQTGYITRDLLVADRGVTLPGSDQRQLDYLTLALERAHSRPTEFIVNFVGVDYGLYYGNFPTTLTWAYTGLVREDGTAKPALAVWDAYRSDTSQSAVTPSSMAAAPSEAIPTRVTFDTLADRMRSVSQQNAANPFSLESPPSPELFVRWQQFASLLPTFVSPPADDPTAPWGFAEPFATAARATLARREALWTYLEPLFAEAKAAGRSPMRSLTTEGAPLFALGDWLLVAPVVEEGASTRDVTLPAGTAWIDWHTGIRYAGGSTVAVAAPLDRIPMFVKVVDAAPQ